MFRINEMALRAPLIFSNEHGTFKHGGRKKSSCTECKGNIAVWNILSVVSIPGPNLPRVSAKELERTVP